MQNHETSTDKPRKKLIKKKIKKKILRKKPVEAVEGEVQRPKKKKIKKIKKKVRKPVELIQPELPFDAESTAAQPSPEHAKMLSQAVENITLRGRAYQLTFGSLGANSRVLNAVERATVLQVHSEEIKSFKHIYDRDDPYLKSLREAQQSIRDYFKMCTIEHPEPSTRLFVMTDPEKSWGDMSQEELHEEMAKQLDAFHRDMQERIDAYKAGPVQAVIDNFDEIVDRAKQKLENVRLFDPTQYPLKEDLPKMLYVRFFPKPSVFPPEYDRISPEMRNQLTQYVRNQLESALSLQLQDVETALMESLNGLKERIENVGEDKARFFKSRVSNVTDAIDQYNQTLRALGVELGSDLTTSLNHLRSTISKAGNDPGSVIKTIRSSEGTRNDVLAELQKAIDRASTTFSPLARQIG